MISVIRVLSFFFQHNFFLKYAFSFVLKCNSIHFRVNQEILNTIKKYLSGVTNKGVYIKKAHLYGSYG